MQFTQYRLARSRKDNTFVQSNAKVETKTQEEKEEDWKKGGFDTAGWRDAQSHRV